MKRSKCLAKRSRYNTKEGLCSIKLVSWLYKKSFEICTALRSSARRDSVLFKMTTNFSEKTAVCIILRYIQRDATVYSLFYLETALHVSGGTSTHPQERKQLYLQHLVFVTPLLLSAAIVEGLEPV
jgi:hypothetical protein